MATRSYVYYFARIVPAYRIAALADLNDRLDDRLVVCSGAPPPGSSLGAIESAPDMGIRNLTLKNTWVSGERVHFQHFMPSFRHFGTPSAILAEESPRSISLPLLMLWARRHDVPIGLWGHFSSNTREHSDVTWRDRYRRFLAGRADACVCYTAAIAENLGRTVSRDRIFVATNTIDTSLLFALHDRLAAEGRESVRRRVGLPEGIPLVAFIGRLTDAEETDGLIDLAAYLQNKSDVGLVVIGDGPARASLEQRIGQERLRHAFVLGAMRSFAESAPFLYASDVLVIPGPAGLAVNHAFALGLPVVTLRARSGMRFHGPEIDYIQNGVNGLVVERGSPEALAQGVERVLERREAYSEAARSYARRHLSLERMVDGLEAAVSALEARGSELHTL